jgi:pyrimidine operon attenuation protein/uracil phosphoribosyltransferase
MSPAASPVLQEAQIRQKVRRIAFEIYENNFDEEELYLVGIEGQGWSFAQMLQAALQEISPLRVMLIRLELNKFAPSQSEIVLHDAPQTLRNKTIILTDDVLNTGRTLAYSLKPFLQEPIRKLEIAVLVNRSHTTFPVQAKYTGYELATTLSEHIRVQLSEGNMAVYLQ